MANLSSKMKIHNNYLKNEKVTFIKMDIEGLEMKAIKGASKIIKEQNARMEEQKASLRAAVLALSKSGMAAEMIAKTLHIEEEKIKDILS